MLTAGLFLFWCVSLVIAHQFEPHGHLWSLPISMFRDGDTPSVGTLLFGVLITTVISHGWTYFRRKEPCTWGVCLIVAIGLCFVAATPSMSMSHDIAALGVMSLGYVYFTLCMIREFLAWDDPLFRATEGQSLEKYQISQHDRSRGKIWRCLFVIHQCMFAVTIFVLPWISGGGAQKCFVTHLLFLMALHEQLPQRRVPSRASRSRQPHKFPK